MPKVTFLPINKTVHAELGESILEVAINNDIPLQHACGGFCSCTTCHIQVRAGSEQLSKMEEMEHERIQETAEKVTPLSRLGCQTRVNGDCSVEIMHLEL